MPAHDSAVAEGFLPLLMEWLLLLLTQAAGCRSTPRGPALVPKQQAFFTRPLGTGPNQNVCFHGSDAFALVIHHTRKFSLPGPRD